MAEMADMAMVYDARRGDVISRLQALSQEAGRGYRTKEWIQRHRNLQRELKMWLRWRENQEHEQQDRLRLEALALSHEYLDLSDLLLWADYAELAMEKSQQRDEERQERERQREEDQALRQERSNQYAYGADRRYREWFSEASGRPVHKGPVGCTDPVYPSLPEGWRFMDDIAFATHWLRLGGYRSAQQTDEQGWTALHHAVQATVYWDMGHRVCRGLISMMDPTWLRAKTWGGRPAGYSALHMACNGSDIRLERGDLVRLLLDKQADLEAEDNTGRTPWLLASGTGIVDVAQALSQAGCDIYRTSWDGRNAADRCWGSSGSMRGWHCMNAICAASPHICYI